MYVLMTDIQGWMKGLIVWLTSKDVGQKMLLYVTVSSYRKWVDI